MAECDKDDMSLTVDDQLVALEIGFTRVVDIPSLVAIKGGVDYVVLLELKQIAIADAELSIKTLSFVGHWNADLLADVLYDYVLWVETRAG